MSVDEFRPSRRGSILSSKVSIEIDLAPRDIAMAFCEMDADHQATFFAEVDKIMQAWNGPASAAWQRYAIACSIKAHDMSGARHWIEDVAGDLDGGK